MSIKSKNVDQFNFLLDEFFVYQGLDDIEKNSIKQDNKLDLMMQNCYDLINEIKKIQSKISKKYIQTKNSSIIKRSSYKFENRNNSKLNLLKIKSLGNTGINISSHNNLLSNNIKKSNKYINLSYFKKNKIINLKKQYSPNLVSNINNRINLEKMNISNQNVKNRNKNIERKKNEKNNLQLFY